MPLTKQIINSKTKINQTNKTLSLTKTSYNYTVVNRFLRYVQIDTASNPNSGEIQDLLVGEQKLYQLIAQKVASEWNYNRNCLLVVGATYAQDLAFLRKTLPEMTFLIPGIGAQGGDLRATVLAAKNEQNTGFIINSSREVIFASSGFSFALDSRQKAQTLRDQINSYLV